MPAGIAETPMNQSSTEKNGWSRQMATWSRPVMARARRTAPVVASEPFLANFTMSARGRTESSFSAASASTSDGRAKLVPSSIAAAAAAFTRGCAWPSETERRPLPYSM